MKIKQFVKDWRQELAAGALVATAAISAGVLNGTDLRLATGLVALATAAGVYRKKQS
jgi:hypothetical protein